ncbi:MAG: hypothetical protein U0354_04160 [Candidatus Sericytochromatia bacterium]
MTQENEKDPIQSLLNELADVDGLLNSAISKATHLENSPRLAKYTTSYDNKSSEPLSNNNENKVVKPSNWGQLKDLALEDSVNAMEDENTLADDTTKVRQMKPKKKLRIDDNWEDDPI